MKYKDCIDRNKTEFESKLLAKRIVFIKNFDKYKLKELIEICKRDNFEVIAAQISIKDTELINEMVSNGFGVYGGVVILKAKLIGDCKKSGRIRNFKINDIGCLRKMTRGAFKNAHWYNCEFIKSELVDELYLKWLENSYNGRADAVLVYEDDNKVLGYISCIIKGNIAVIDLIAVSKEFRGKGIGECLVNAAKGYCKKRGIGEMEVKTELGNTGALNLYNKCGFKLAWIGLNINRWLK